MTPDDREPTLLVVGAAAGSLGAAIADEAAGNWEFGRIFTAGLGNGEALYCDVRNVNSIKDCLQETMPTYVVCTVGVNEPHHLGVQGLALTMSESFLVNVIGPMEVLRHFMTTATRHPDAVTGKYVKKFAAISSNSARIPRTGSAPYCASKAALSMALRVAARELATHEDAPYVWGYEPGLLAGTPMTEATLQHFGNPNENVGVPPLHRMKGVGPLGLSVQDLAHRVVHDLAYGGPGLNGCLFPFDAGEL